MTEENQSNDENVLKKSVESTSSAEQSPKPTIKSAKAKKDNVRYSGDGRLKMKLPWQASKDSNEEKVSDNEVASVENAKGSGKVESLPRQVISLNTNGPEERETNRKTIQDKTESAIIQEKSTPLKETTESPVTRGKNVPLQQAASDIASAHEQSEQLKTEPEIPVVQERVAQPKPAPDPTVAQKQGEQLKKEFKPPVVPIVNSAKETVHHSEVASESSGIERNNDQPAEQAVQQEIQLESVTHQPVTAQIKKRKSKTVAKVKQEEVLQDEIIKHVSDDTEEPVQKPNKSHKSERLSKFSWLTFFSGIVVGCILGGAIGAISAYKWYDANNTFRQQYTDYKTTADKTIKEQKEQLDKMEEELENHQFQLNNVSLGYSQISKILERSDIPPSKPRYKEVGNGILVYWIDDVLWRRYFVYQARGRKGKFSRKFRKAQKKNFIYLPKLKKGTYRFAISALDREGKETEKSDQVTVIIRK